VIWSWVAGKAWWLAAAATLLALFLSQEARVSNAKARMSRAETVLAEYRATAEAAARTASEQARAEEARRVEQTRKVVEDAKSETLAAQASAAAASDAAGQLRQRVATLVAAAKRQAGSDPKPAGRSAGVDDPDPLGMLTVVLSRHDTALQRVAAYADSLKIAGLACERQYDGLTVP